MQCTICQTSDLEFDPVLRFLVLVVCRLSPDSGLNWRGFLCWLPKVGPRRSPTMMAVSLGDTEQHTQNIRSLYQRLTIPSAGQPRNFWTERGTVGTTGKCRVHRASVSSPRRLSGPNSPLTSSMSSLFQHPSLRSRLNSRNGAWLRDPSACSDGAYASLFRDARHRSRA